MKKIILLFLFCVFVYGCKTIDDPSVNKKTTLRVYNSNGRLIFTMPSSDKPFIIKLNGDISITMTEENQQDLNSQIEKEIEKNDKNKQE